MSQLTEDAPAPTTVMLSPLPVLLASETILSIFILLGPYLCLSFEHRPNMATGYHSLGVKQAREHIW